MDDKKLGLAKMVIQIFNTKRLFMFTPVVKVDDATPRVSWIEVLKPLAWC